MVEFERMKERQVDLKLDDRYLSGKREDVQTELAVPGTSVSYVSCKTSSKRKFRFKQLKCKPEAVVASIKDPGVHRPRSYSSEFESGEAEELVKDLSTRINALHSEGKTWLAILSQTEKDQEVVEAEKLPDSKIDDDIDPSDLQALNVPSTTTIDDDEASPSLRFSAQDLLKSFECAVLTPDGKRALHLEDDVLTEKEMLTGKALFQISTCQIKYLSKDFFGIKLQFLNGVKKTYTLEDPDLLQDLFFLLSSSNARGDTITSPSCGRSGSPSSAKDPTPKSQFRLTSRSPDPSSSDFSEDTISSLPIMTQDLVIISDYFPKETNRSSRSSSVNPKAVIEERAAPDSTLAEFLSQVKKRDISEKFSLRFEISVMEYKSSSSEKNCVLLLAENRLYLLDFVDVSSCLDQGGHVGVLCNQEIIAIRALVLGLFLRYCRIDLENESSFLLMTRDKEITSRIVQGIVMTFSNLGRDLPVISNLDRETLDIITVA